jgi:hypothetical protein
MNHPADSILPVPGRASIVLRIAAAGSPQVHADPALIALN